MIRMIIPIIVIVASNCFYHIFSKTIAGDVNAFGSLMVTYVTAALITGILFVVFVGPDKAVSDLSGINLSSFLLGVAIVGLEAGYIYAYRFGWQVNNAPLVANTCLAIALLIIGAILFNEGVSFKQIIGMLLCIIGLIF